ncbi:MAG: hypothetical protein FJW76_06085 [Actinobacteria bacterium]|nr:hypothetical protein [Actinomycetota bacterium]
MKIRTAISAAFSTLLLSWTNIAPSFSLTKRDDGDDPGTLMSAGDAVLVFAGIPLAVTALMVVLIWAPSRGRSKTTGISKY